MRGLIGFSGFVGQHLLEQTNFNCIYRSSNISNIRGKVFDILVCAGVPAVKWLANAKPEEDMLALEELIEHLRSTRARRFILVSTIDVYANTSSEQSEDLMTDEPSHPYGKHRLWFEERVKEIFEVHHIARLPALFGRYMKKNYLFDLLHNRKEFIEKIDFHSSFQWYNMENLWKDVCLAIENSLSVVNLFTQPLQTRTLIEEVFPNCMHMCNDDSQRTSTALSYNVCTKHAKIWGSSDRYIKSSLAVLEEIKIFVRDYRPQIQPKRLCVSNIAWDETDHDSVLQFLEMKGISNIEVAPTKILASWEQCDKFHAAEAIRSKLPRFRVESLQSVLFNTEGLELFGTESVRAVLEAHCKRVVDLASNLGAHVVVWGSPKQRLMHGKPSDECFQIAVKFFKSIGDYAHSKHVVIGFEPNARAYGCDFCYSAAQAATLVRATGSAGFRLHLDAANMHLENDDFASTVRDNRDILCHVQVSEPFLSGFDTPQVRHDAFAAQLKDAKYGGAVSIEMRKGNETLLSIARAVAYTVNTYYDLLST